MHITLYDEVVDEKDVEAHLKTMTTWKTTLEHHIQGMEKYVAKTESLLE